MKMNTITNVKILSRIMVEYIQSYCDCYFPLTNIIQQNFQCLANNSIKFKATIIPSYNITSILLVEALKDFILRQNAVQLQGQILNINFRCSVVLNYTDNIFNCSLTSRSHVIVIAITSSLIAISIITLLLFVALLFITTKRKKK